MTSVVVAKTLLYTESDACAPCAITVPDTPVNVAVTVEGVEAIRSDPVKSSNASKNTPPE